jgi:hypothetical protein
MWFRTELFGKSRVSRRWSTDMAPGNWESFEPRRLLSVALPAAEFQRVTPPNATGAAGVIVAATLAPMTAEDGATKNSSGGSFSGSVGPSEGMTGTDEIQAGDSGQSGDGDIPPLLGKVSW